VEVVNMSTEAGTLKVIQVSMPQPLLEAVTHYAKAQKESRAAFIRRALERYLAELREQEMEEAYIQGYQRIPEEVSVGETGAKLAALVFSEEEW
jgi:metal-responsive CopG/Arc/MetJ family transcriptional regulator